MNRNIVVLLLVACFTFVATSSVHAQDCPDFTLGQIKFVKPNMNRKAASQVVPTVQIMVDGEEELIEEPVFEQTWLIFACDDFTEAQAVQAACDAQGVDVEEADGTGAGGVEIGTYVEPEEGEDFGTYVVTDNDYRNNQYEYWVLVVVVENECGELEYQSAIIYASGKKNNKNH
jgi:hypothetical protein